MVRFIPEDAGATLKLWVLASFLSPDFEAVDRRAPLPDHSTVPAYCQFCGEVQGAGTTSGRSMYCARCKPVAQSEIEQTTIAFEQAVATESYHKEPLYDDVRDDLTAALTTAQLRDIASAEQEHRLFGVDPMDIDSDGDAPGHAA